jgi:hypothetical protein
VRDWTQSASHRDAKDGTAPRVKMIDALNSCWIDSGAPGNIASHCCHGNSSPFAWHSHDTMRMCPSQQIKTMAISSRCGFPYRNSSGKDRRASQDSLSEGEDDGFQNRRIRLRTSKCCFGSRCSTMTLGRLPSNLDG